MITIQIFQDDFVVEVEVNDTKIQNKRKEIVETEIKDSEIEKKPKDSNVSIEV